MEKAKLRYDWEFILLKMFKYHATGDRMIGLKRAKISNFGGFISWEMVKQGTAGDVFY